MTHIPFSSTFHFKPVLRISNIKSSKLMMANEKKSKAKEPVTLTAAVKCVSSCFRCKIRGKQDRTTTSSFHIDSTHQQPKSFLFAADRAKKFSKNTFCDVLSKIS